MTLRTLCTLVVINSLGFRTLKERKYVKIKKIIAAAVIALGLAGCGNLDMLDTNYTYNYALTKWPDGTMKKIEVKQWCDYEGEQVQVIVPDGTIYLLSMNNTVLVREADR